MRRFRRIANQIWSLLYYSVIAFFVDRPRRVRFINSVLAFHDREKNAKRFPTIEFSVLYPNASSLHLEFQDFKYQDGNVSFPELTILAAIARIHKPKVVFEFGTGDGLTTLHLALNGHPDAHIYTLDLPKDVREFQLPLDPGDHLFIKSRIVRDRSIKSSHVKNIEQFLVDSAFFDTTSLRGKIDLLFIDGAHSYEYVQSDTRKALEMLAKDGVIVWHDYLVWNGVTDYLNELSVKRKLFHIAGTSLVVYQSSTSIE